jgi:hypothetical protein
MADGFPLHFQLNQYQHPVRDVARLAQLTHLLTSLCYQNELEQSMALLRLAGKTAVITGAGSGIGKAIAMEFSRNGELNVATFTFRGVEWTPPAGEVKCCFLTVCSVCAFDTASHTQAPRWS